MGLILSPSTPRDTHSVIPGREGKAFIRLKCMGCGERITDTVECDSPAEDAQMICNCGAIFWPECAAPAGSLLIEDERKGRR